MDTIFAVASMTKPVTYIWCDEAGREREDRLDDPISKYLPELKALCVPGDPKYDTESEVATVPARRSITVRDLLSHTSGFSYGRFRTNNDRLEKSYAQGCRAAG